MASDATGLEALAHIDTVLAKRPHRDDATLSQATLCLTTFRDRLVAQWRQTGLDPRQRTRLGHVNAVITIVLGIHFPLGDIPWPELEKARAWLADAVREDEPVA